MEEDLFKIKKVFLQYMNIIAKEYSNSKVNRVIDKLNHNEEIIKFNEKDSISFFVINEILWLPKAAYNYFPLLEKYDNYGTKKNTGRNINDYLDTNTTYMDYINHIIEGGLSVYDYFEESLLHETMHICGSQGGTPLEEGINELKTRELAQKYNIKIAAYGYSKEVEVAKHLQEILGKEIMDELTFVSKNNRYDFLLMRVGAEKANLYQFLSDKMIEISKEYYNKLDHIANPFEKARLYEMIDYSELYQLIDSKKFADDKDASVKI